MEKETDDLMVQNIVFKKSIGQHFWNHANQHLVARAFLNFFLHTKKFRSGEWTEVWHVRTNKKMKTYKLYDCGEYYLKCIYQNYRNGIPTFEEKLAKKAFQKWCEKHRNGEIEIAWKNRE